MRQLMVDSERAHKDGTCRCDEEKCTQGHVGADGGHCECGDPTSLDAKAQAPWAAEIVVVDGGYMAFESREDARVWLAQK